MDYLVPADVAAAVAMRGAGCTVLAGGTDLYPQHVGRPMTEPVIDIGGLSELRGIEETAGAYRIEVQLEHRRSCRLQPEWSDRLARTSR